MEGDEGRTAPEPEIASESESCVGVTSLGFGLEAPKSRRGEGTAAVGDDGEMKTLCPSGLGGAVPRMKGEVGDLRPPLAIGDEGDTEGSSLAFMVTVDNGDGRRGEDLIGLFGIGPDLDDPVPTDFGGRNDDVDRLGETLVGSFLQK